MIDVSPLFLNDVAEFSAKRALRAKGYDAARSYIDHALAFPRNVTVEAVLTYSGLEREGEDVEYFYRFSPEGYAIAINVMLHQMTH